MQHNNWFFFWRKELERKILHYWSDTLEVQLAVYWKESENIEKKLFSDNKSWIMEKSLMEITSPGIWTKHCKFNKGYTDGLAEQELEEILVFFLFFPNSLLLLLTAWSIPNIFYAISIVGKS